MKYNILRTDKMNDQLFSAIQYIADDSGSIERALAYLNELETAIGCLANTPHMGSLPRYAILKKQGYRVLIVQRHLLFYKVNDEKHQVILYALFDARQNYLNLL